METLLKGLNAAQRSAVTSSASVLQVLAPPGSGKTKTLTSRVAYLVSHHGYKPQNVICCTFTIKASREMRERLRGIVGSQLESKLILGTFHSICRRYLVTYGHLIQIPRNFGIADSDDSLGILKQLQKKIKFGMDPRVARNKISHRKARGQRLEDVLKQTGKSVDAQEFALIFREYESALAVSNLLDYDDLLLRCVDLLRQFPDCVSNIEALLIDEFQDTNNVQFELMRLLASAKKRITIVGDPDQSIYGFRSAEIENLNRMREYYPNTEVVNLEENYRSSSAVLKLAQEVIEQDSDRPDKKLKSTHRYGTLPVLRRLHNPHEEAAWIVSEIKRVTKMTGNCVEYSDIAILLRSAFLSLLIEKGLANSGIPYKMVGGRRFFDRVEVRIILDYLRTISHPENNSALLSIINVPSRKIGDGTLAELNRAAERSKASLWTVIQQALKGEISLDKKPSKPAEQGLRELVTLVKKGQAKLKTYEPAKAPGQLIDLVASSLQFESFLRKQYREDWQERWENVKELSIQAMDVTLQSLTAEDQLPEIEGLQQAETNGAQETLTRFLANVALSTEVEAENEGEVKSRVTISTIHSAKGLEWPVVFVPAVYEGSIPHSRAEDTNEERRLLYVAMTRAKALLYMTFPVLQSRGESESILSQILPNTLDCLMLTTGPRFSDQVVQDIATILDRPFPSQEALAEAVTKLGDNESQYDDIWSEDGSARPQHGNTFTVWQSTSNGGQTFEDFMKVHNNGRQTSNFSTMAGFTTASHQMSIAPPEMLQSSTKDKPKLVKTLSGQGNLNAFFNRKPETSKENIQMLPKSQTVSKPGGFQNIRDSIPPHPLPNLASSIKRPRPVLTDNPDTNNRASKRAYTCFSSSPIREDFPNEVSLPVKTSTNQPKQPAASPPKPKYNTTMSAMQSLDRSKQGFQNFNKSGVLNTLSRPQPLSSMPGFVNLNGINGNGKKTLGVRRTMNGWADRKNK